MNINKDKAITILRWGLAFTFFYAAVTSLLHPDEWFSYLPSFIGNFVSLRFALAVFSAYEIAVASLLFIGKKLYWVSLIALITLVVLILSRLDNLNTAFRDVGLAMSSLALFELVRKQPMGRDNELV